MWSSQKCKNIDALGSGTARTGACILAFFNVVASSQICPHFKPEFPVFAFQVAKLIKNYDIRKLNIRLSPKRHLSFSKSTKYIIFAL